MYTQQPYALGRDIPYASFAYTFSTLSTLHKIKNQVSVVMYLLKNKVLQFHKIWAEMGPYGSPRAHTLGK